MKTNVRPRVVMGAMVLAIIVGLAGCTTSPSVAPLIRIGAQAMREEAKLQEADLARDLAKLEQNRQTLTAAFNADLSLMANKELTATWVQDATEAYTAAREELVRHEMAIRQERAQRAGNLRLAALAQDRAMSVLEKQDQLWLDLLGTDVWQWLPAHQSFESKETK